MTKQPMTIDKQALRDIAEKTKIAGEAPVMPFEQRINALNDFMKHFTPATVLALLDEVEHYKSREERVTKLVLDNSASWDELYKKLEAAEKRIADYHRVLNNLAAVARRYLPDYDEHPDIQAAEELLESAAGIGKGE